MKNIYFCTEVKKFGFQNVKKLFTYCLLVATALSQLTSILNSARQGSTVAYPRGRYTRVTSKQQKQEVTESSNHELSQIKTDIPEVNLESCLSLLEKKENLHQLSQFVELYNEQLEIAEEHNNKDSSYVSADTFFENKNGFEETLLDTSTYRPKYFPFVGMNGPKLLIHPTLIPLMQQTRGFMTYTKDRPTSNFGLGSKGKTDASKDEKVAKSLKKVIEAFLRPDKEKEGSDSKKVELGDVFEKGKNTTINVVVKNEDSEGFMNKIGKSWTQRLMLIALIYCLLVLWNRNSGKLPGVVNLSPNNFEINPEMVNVTFKDVKGIDEVRDELQDIVNFLTNPEKYHNVGAKLPKGVLLVGRPGVGKTLVAKAIAGEAGVPFFHASGSEFDEIFVGMGAKRVRQLFGSAKVRAPSIVFIDEIDAVGSKRVNSPFTPHANQTINQLLSEMDGFSTKDGVIVIGATNKKENLDAALLRPGRFDVEIGVIPPDIKGRKDMFELYLKKVKTGPDLDIDRLAKLTFGLTGAEISNIVNQAALFAVKNNREAVIMQDLLDAKDKCTMGPEMKNRKITKEDKYHTACHEAGHALVAHYTKHANKVNKVTVVPRGSSLGHTQMLPDKDFSHSRTKQELLAMIDTCLGGRLGEEMFIGPDDVSVGCSSDFQRATDLAVYMVKEVGMSEKIGHRVINGNDSSVSDEVKTLCDGEVNRILKESYERARKILESHKEEHKRLVDALMIHENVDKDELDLVLKGTFKKDPPSKQKI